MKPIAVFRHSLTEGPGPYRNIHERQTAGTSEVIAIDQRRCASRPIRPAFAGLCFMGGPMSVNDPLPWIPEALSLIRTAVAADVPVIGHCLGGQLMSKALGGVVSGESGEGDRLARCGARRCRRRVTGSVTATVSCPSTGTAKRSRVPDGATRLLSSDACENQAWAMGKHLAMQCHIEMTEAMVREWCIGGASEIRAAATQPTVQSPASRSSRIWRRGSQHCTPWPKPPMPDGAKGCATEDDQAACGRLVRVSRGNCRTAAGCR
jgi:GMP synthase-like glutamine amidotransferase